MRTPDTLNALVDHGIIEEVLRPLMSGKEAQIYLVLSDGEQRVAKIYKEAQNRTFQNRADYTEGRKVRNSRDQRAMGSRSKHGRAQNEAAWKSAEVDMIYRLREAGVRVPTPYQFIDGVLIMELVTDADGFPAPRLGDLTFEPEEATEIFHKLMAEVVRMLCAGVVHGDLSDFNVLLGADGPVVIDFPQAVDASGNANARKLLLRDVDNLHRFHAKWAPAIEALPYAQEMWDLYSRNALTPDARLSGKFRTAKKAVSTEAVLDLIADADHDERRRREARGLTMRGAPTLGARTDPRAALPVERPAAGRAPHRGPAEPRSELRGGAPRGPLHGERAREQAPAQPPRGHRNDRQLSPPQAAQPAQAQRSQHLDSRGRGQSSHADPRAPVRQDGPRLERAAAREAPQRNEQAQRNERAARWPSPRADAPTNTRDDGQAQRHDRAFSRDERQAPREDRQAPRIERPAPREDRQAPRADRQAPREDRQAPRADQRFLPAQRNERVQRNDWQAPRAAQEPSRQAPRSERADTRPAHAAAQTGGWGQRGERPTAQREQTRDLGRSPRSTPQPDGPLTSDDPSTSPRNRRP